MCLHSVKCSEAEYKVEGSSTGRALPKRLLNGVERGTQSSEKQLRPSPVSLILIHIHTTGDNINTISAAQHCHYYTLHTRQSVVRREGSPSESSVGGSLAHISEVNLTTI